MDVKAFPENINFRSIRSYGLAGEVKKGEFPSTLWEVGSSWYLLPEKPMVQRVFDERVGYFAFALDGMVKRGDWMDKTMIATRWRLEPRPEDVEKYLRGELVSVALTFEGTGDERIEEAVEEMMKYVWWVNYDQRD